MPKELFKTVEINKRTYVVRYLNRMRGKTNEPIAHREQPNFMGTGMALCGVLNNGQTLDGFIAWQKLKKEGYKK